MVFSIEKKAICIMWIAKILFDMFYEIKALSVLITLFAGSLLFYAALKEKIRFHLCDVIIILLCILFTLSLLKSPDYFLDYLKINSCFMLYFIGRYYYLDIDKVWNSLTKALLMALLVNTFVCLIGEGTTVWGSAITYKGLYFFKTDFAVMLIFFLITWIYNKQIQYASMIPIFLSIVLILLCNARIVYLCTFIIAVLFYQYKNKMKNIISIKSALLLTLSAFVCIFLLKYVSTFSLFASRGLISLSFDSLSDLMDSSNTQGRNEIWALLLTAFNQQDFVTRMFGAGLDFNDFYGLDEFNEHSTYVKLILNTGYLGLILFLLFILKIIGVFNKIENKKISFYSVSIMLVFIIVGVSVPTILYTNCSWLPMFMAGVCVSTYIRQIQ